MVTASLDNTARVWDAATGKANSEAMEHKGSVYAAQFSPDGQRVVTASEDGTARLWDALSGKPIGGPMEHEAIVASAQFSPDGQRILTASYDKTARLWDVPTISNKDGEEDVLLLAELAKATGGVAMHSLGQAEILNVLTPDQVKNIFEKIIARFAGPPSQVTPLQRFLKWSVSGTRTRSISPFSELTVAKWIDNRIDEGTLDGLRAAIQVDPANACLAAHFSRVLADYAHDALAKGTDADEARRAKEEADFQAHRALKLASGNEEVKALCSEVVTRLQSIPGLTRLLVRIGDSDIKREGSAIFYESGMQIDFYGGYHAYHPDRTSGLDFLGNAGRPGRWEGLATENGMPSGNPVIQTANDPAPGFYVSSTSLQDESRDRKDPRRYVNSEAVNYISIPGRPTLGAKLGDFAVVIHPETGAYAYSVYADEGPFGAGSIALANALGIPSTNSGGISHGIVYIVFPGTTKGWPLSRQEIDQHGANLFANWGGMAKASLCFPNLNWR